IQLGSRKTIGIFTVLGALILIIACINYVNLTTARAMHRSKEVSIKKIVGANRVTLFLQFVCESLLFISVAISASILLVHVLMPVFNLLTENRFQFPFSSVGVWSLVGTTVLISTIFISVYPAFLLSSFQPLTAVRGSSFLPIKGHQFRQILVVLQST